MSSVSVVIPTYNASPFIAETLASVFAQTRLPDEVIVVDDCSPDGTVALVESIATTAPVPVRVIRMAKNSGGPSAPMNVGVRASASDMIVLLDQDDVMMSDRVALHTEALGLSGIGLSFGWVSRIDAVGVRHAGVFRTEPLRVVATASREASRGVWLLDPALIYEDALLRGAIIGASNVALSRTLWAAAGGFREDLRVCWDYEFFCQATRHTTFAFTDACVAEYRMHGGNLHVVSDKSSAEWVDLLGRHYADPLWPIDRAALAAVIRETYNDCGYKYSAKLRPFAAAKAYATAVRYGASRFSSVRRTVKAFARAARDRLLLSQTPLPSPTVEGGP